MSDLVKRGEIHWVDWDPSRGSEQAGKRPALILQNDTGNRHSPTTIVAACSTAPKKQYPFVVAIAKSESGLPKDSSIDLAAIMTIDQSRLCGKVGELTAAKMAEVEQALKYSLALS